MRAAGVGFGTKFFNSEFVQVFEHCLAQVSQHMLGRVMVQAVASLGIRSDFGLLADSATIGKVFRSVRGTVLLIGAFFSTPSHPTQVGRIHTA